MAALLIGSVVVATIVSVAIGNTSLADLSLPVGLIVWPIILGAQIYRYRHCSSLVQRQQTKWLLIGMAMFVLNVVVAITFLLSGLAASYQWLNFVLCYGAGFGMIVACGFAVLRYQLFDVDLVINRTLVYSALTLCLIGLYALIAGGLGALFQAQGDIVIAVVDPRPRLGRRRDGARHGEYACSRCTTSGTAGSSWRQASWSFWRARR
jgi:hypothetical protein